MSTLFQRYSLIPLTSILTGSIIGFVEALWLLQNTGAPDRLALLYGTILYGVAGGGFGLVAMIFAALIKKQSWTRFYHFLGALFAAMPIGSFVLFYQIRKVIYAEKMPPIHILACIPIAMFAFAALFLFFRDRKILSSSRIALLCGLLTLIGFGGWITLPGGSSNFAQKITRPAIQKETPNVVFLLIDTLRADYISAYDEMEIKTPHMDSLANDGVLFTQNYAQASWTRPSGVSIFSSRIPSGHSTQIKAAAAPDESVFFTEVLYDAGIRTAGLANNINLTATFNLDQGYDAFVYTEPEYPLYGSESVFGLTLYKVLEKLASRFGSESNRTVQSYYQPADTLISLSKSFLENNSSDPWMLYLHLMEPHDPYFEHPILKGSGAEYSGLAYGRKEHEHPDTKDLDLILDLYRQEVEFLDLKIGEFLEYLKQQKLYDNTMIVLVSDHGEEFHEHGGFWHGTTLYDEVLRVPLIIKLPKSELAGSKVPWQVRSIDIAPTITAALNLKADPSWEGQNLFSEAARLAMTNPQPNSQDCQSLREHPMDRIVIAENNFEGNILSSIRLKGFKYILANKDNNRNLAPEELYDISADAKEQTNLVGTQKQICEQKIDIQTTLLKTVLGEAINTALQSAASSTGVQLDEATIQKMRALGYMSDQE